MNPYLPRDTTPPGHWTEQAACATPGASADLWHGTEVEQAVAKRICVTRCPVRDDCLAAALAAPSSHQGVSGGLTAEERAAIRKGRVA